MTLQPHSNGNNTASTEANRAQIRSDLNGVQSRLTQKTNDTFKQNLHGVLKAKWGIS